MAGESILCLLVSYKVYNFEQNDVKDLINWSFCLNIQFSVHLWMFLPCEVHRIRYGYIRHDPKPDRFATRFIETKPESGPKLNFHDLEHIYFYFMQFQVILASLKMDPFRTRPVIRNCHPFGVHVNLVY